MKKLLLTLALSVSALAGFAQEATPPNTEANSKQVLATEPYKHFQLYEGDVIKFEVDGENKKFDVHTGAGYGWSDSKKVKDITAHTINISKDGVYTIGWMPALFQKASKVSVIRVPAPGKENASTVAAKDNETITVKDDNIYRGSTVIGALSVQSTDDKYVYKISNAAGAYVASFVATKQAATSGPAIKKIEIYKAYDVISTATPLKTIDNTNLDRPDQMSRPSSYVAGCQ